MPASAVPRLAITGSPRPPGIRPRAARLAAGIVAFATLLAGACPALAQGPALDDSAVKAAFVYNFALFTEWPESALPKAAKLRLCIAGGPGEFADALRALAQKAPARGHEIETRAVAAPAEAAECHILVATHPERGLALVRSVRSRPVLTIGDAPAVAAAGGIIRLFVEADRVRFEINTDAADRASIRFSSQLLRLARLVKDAAP